MLVLPHCDPKEGQKHAKKFLVGIDQERQQADNVHKDSRTQEHRLFLLFLNSKDQQQTNVGRDGFFMHVKAKQEEERSAEKDKSIEGDVVVDKLYDDWQGEKQDEDSSEERRNIWQYFQLMKVWGDLSKTDAATCVKSREDEIDQFVSEVIECPEVRSPVLVNQASLERKQTW